MNAPLPATSPVLMRTIEQLNYRVTVGDVAARAGLDLELTQQGLMTLASESGGDLQVSETGEIVYLFGSDFRNVLRHKFLRLRVKEVVQKIWQVVFYGIRVSFGLVLIGLMLAAAIAILVLIFAASRGENDGGGFDFGGDSFSSWWFGDLVWFFDWDLGRRRNAWEFTSEQPELSFLESIFSFLFGDGNPNAQLEERRWRSIGHIIRQHRGAVIAEQITPFLDETETLIEGESSILPVLVRFCGEPEVSPTGNLVYHFPGLQKTATTQQQTTVGPYLREHLWVFSQATPNQQAIAIVLGVVLLLLGIVLNAMVASAATIPGWISMVAILSLAYSLVYLAIPLCRYVWQRWQNQKIVVRNQRRQAESRKLDRANSHIQQKLYFAQEFAAEHVIRQEDLVYTTEEDFLPQELNQAGREWNQKLEERHPETH